VSPPSRAGRRCSFTKSTILLVKRRGRLKVSDVFTLSLLAVNLRRLPRLLIARRPWPEAE